MEQQYAAPYRSEFKTIARSKRNQVPFLDTNSSATCYVHMNQQQLLYICTYYEYTSTLIFSVHKQTRPTLLCTPLATCIFAYVLATPKKSTYSSQQEEKKCT